MPGTAGCVTFDGRGNGRSDRPTEPEAYAQREFAADAIAVMDATRTDARGHRRLSRWVDCEACCSPPTIPSGSTAAVFIGPIYPGGGEPLPEQNGVLLARTSSTPTRAGRSTTSTTGSATTRASSSSSCRRVFTEPHSTKPIEDTVGWGLETTGETLVVPSRTSGLRT